MANQVSDDQGERTEFGLRLIKTSGACGPEISGNSECDLELEKILTFTIIFWGGSI